MGHTMVKSNEADAIPTKGHKHDKVQTHAIVWLALKCLVILANHLLFPSAARSPCPIST